MPIVTRFEIFQLFKSFNCSFFDFTSFGLADHSSENIADIFFSPEIYLNFVYVNKEVFGQPVFAFHSSYSFHEFWRFNVIRKANRSVDNM